ncbi:MAG: Control of competence regulator ComK, YlbF/YmcA [Haloplasmataceae bacterium]|jgi:cell fate (sporulation/competence/biofilm development) regulator YlbF (YheA/YmcA/DUF963 family)|nr:Control of competence regulator ComK, YlbF/YmcA [Haloplasmataceae bacterium]
MENTKIIQKAYELALAIKESDVYKDYLKYEKMIQNDEVLTNILEEFNKRKSIFEEANKYGRYYPGIEKINADYQEVKIKLMKNELFKKYKEAEKQLDIINYQIETSLKGVVNIKEKHGKTSIKFIE